MMVFMISVVNRFKIFNSIWKKISKDIFLSENNNNKKKKYIIKYKLEHRTNKDKKLSIRT